MRRFGLGIAAGAVGSALGVAGLKYLGYGRSLDSEEIRKQREKNIKEAAFRKPAYMGVKRTQEAQTVLEKLNESVVVLYHPTINGKSQLAAYIQATSPRPVLLLVGKGTEEANIQQFDPQPPYPADGLIRFWGIVVTSFFKHKDPLFIIDSPEQMPPQVSKEFLTIAYPLKRDSISDALVVTNSLEMVEIVQTKGEVRIHELSDPTQEEYVAIAAGLGMAPDTAEALYRQWGGSLEVLLKTKEQSDYAESLQTAYIRQVRTLLESKPDLKQQFQQVYETVTSSTPLGNTYIDDEAAQMLHKAGLMVAYPNESLRFRNQIAVSALHKALNPS